MRTIPRRRFLSEVRPQVVRVAPSKPVPRDGRSALPRLLATVVILLPATGSPAGGATLHVPGDYPTIQAAVSAAQDGDTVLVADGTYTGNGNRFIGSGGLAITIRSENGAQNTIIDCENAGPAFFLVADEPPAFVIEGFTITNGSGSSGGAIFIHHASQAISRNCVFVGNSAFRGGAVHCETNSSPTFVHCVFAGNAADYGGGVLSFADVAPFAEALLSGDEVCHAADVNGDGRTNGAEVRPFVTELVGG